MNYELKAIASIRTDFPTKFGIPRQSGLVKGLKGRIVFEPEYRDPEALRGLELFSHIWLLWDFSEARAANSKLKNSKFKATVRPPRLGGPEGPVITVEGADLMDGTPIFDIKPYLPFTDNHPEAIGGFAEETFDSELSNDAKHYTFDSLLLKVFDEEKLQALREILASDPRPHYHNDPDRVYVLPFADKEVKFRIKGGEVEAWL